MLPPQPVCLDIVTCSCENESCENLVDGQLNQFAVVCVSVCIYVSTHTHTYA